MSETMETKEMTTVEPMETEVIDSTEESYESSNKLTGFIVAGVVGLAAAGAVAVQKLKAKKNADKPKKKVRKKLMLVEVPDEEDDIVNSDATEVETEETTEE